MGYRYVCGVCETVSDHDSRAEAEAERDDHQVRAHHGRAPLREWVSDLDAPMPHHRASFRREVLGSPCSAS